MDNRVLEISKKIKNKKNWGNNIYQAYQLAQKLNDPKTSSKICWSILKTFCNDKNILDFTIVYKQ